MVDNGKSRPRFKAGISYAQSMLEREDRLIPVIRVLQDIAGVPLTRLVLPTSSLPLLEMIDGECSVEDIINALTLQDQKNGHDGTTESEAKIISIVQELYKQALVEPVRELV
jgi:hypothetical protein